jgi:hypothetical protein
VSPLEEAKAQPRAATAGNRRLKNYLLDRGLQLRYIVVVLVVSVVIAGGLGVLLAWQARSATDIVLQAAVAPPADGVDFMTPELEEFVETSKRADDRGQLLLLVGVGLGVALVLSGYLLITTHKVAGPLYKISLYFDRMTEGRLPKVYDLRKGDQLQSFFERFKLMDEALRQRAEDDVRVFEKILAAADEASAQTGEMQAAIAAIRQRLEAKKRALD